MYYTPKGSEIDATRYPDLRKWVIGCLSGHKKPNEIIFQLCRRTGWDWGQAKRFVEQVVEMDQKQIHQKRMPLLIGIGMLFMIMGAFAFILGVNDLLEAISKLQNSPDISTILGLIFNLPRLAMDPLGFMIRLAIVYGPAMFIGGAWGTWSAVKSAMTGEGEDLLKPQTPPQA
jgi:hypothetical protein